MYSREKNWSNILRCKGTKIWRDQILDNRFRYIVAEIGIEVPGSIPGATRFSEK
jgi:hypothetical protein